MIILGFYKSCCFWPPECMCFDTGFDRDFGTDFESAVADLLHLSSAFLNLLFLSICFASCFLLSLLKFLHLRFAFSSSLFTRLFY